MKLSPLHHWLALRLIGFLGLAILASPAPYAWADLQPEEVALIVARGNSESLALAKYYCQKRGVPVEHLCEVDVPSTEVIDRDQWRSKVRPEIQHWIAENDPDAKLKCLVTTWGVPLKIGPAKPDAAAQIYRDHITRERVNRLQQLERSPDSSIRWRGNRLWARRSPPCQPNQPRTPSKRTSSGRKCGLKAP